MYCGAQAHLTAACQLTRASNATHLMRPEQRDFLKAIHKVAGFSLPFEIQETYRRHMVRLPL